MKNVFEKIVTQTGEYLKRYHLESLVLGLSGGLDSTVCAAVSYEVAKRYGTTTEDILRANELNGQQPEEGTLLLIPRKR